MAPNESTNSELVGGTTHRATTVRAASTIVLLSGIWLFVSPWVYGVYGHANAWNSWIVGAILFIFGWIRVARPAYSVVLSWCNTVLGIWTFFSPWIYGYSNDTDRFINSLCVGVIVFVLSIASATMAAKMKPVPMSHA
jgi:SPW repeat